MIKICSERKELFLIERNCCFSEKTFVLSVAAIKGWILLPGKQILLFQSYLLCKMGSKMGFTVI